MLYLPQKKRTYFFFCVGSMCTDTKADCMLYLQQKKEQTFFFVWRMAAFLYTVKEIYMLRDARMQNNKRQLWKLLFKETKIFFIYFEDSKLRKCKANGYKMTLHTMILTGQFILRWKRESANWFLMLMTHAEEVHRLDMLSRIWWRRFAGASILVTKEIMEHTAAQYNFDHIFYIRLHAQQEYTSLCCVNAKCALNNSMGTVQMIIKYLLLVTHSIPTVWAHWIPNLFESLIRHDDLWKTQLWERNAYRTSFI